MTKIAFFGNCQIEAISKILESSNSGCEITYQTNTNRHGSFDPDGLRKTLDESDLIISQAIANRDNEFSKEQMTEKYGSKVIFAPYVFFDGLFSMSLALTSVKARPTGVLNHDPISESIKKIGLQRTLGRYRSGRLNLNHKKRLDFNIKYSRENEKLCSFPWVDDFLENFYSEKSMITHNHPTPKILNMIAEKISNLTGLYFKEVNPDDFVLYSRIVLPNPGAVITPMSKNEIGFKFDYDLQWFPESRNLINRVAKEIRD
jgi:hypothetical protein